MATKRQLARQAGKFLSWKLGQKVTVRPLPFPALVKRWRSVRKLTKADAARQLGVPYRTFQSWELGDRTPRGLAGRLIRMRLTLTANEGARQFQEDIKSLTTRR